jgi:hypothetical protein
VSTTAVTQEHTEDVGSAGGRPPHRRDRWVAVAVVLVLVTAAVVVWLGGGFDRGGSGNGSSGNAPATSLATVQRRTLSSQQQFNGVLGYAGSYTVLAQLQGVITWLPQVGRVVHQGQVLYRVDGAPVVLLSGATPAYRTLAEGATASSVKGRDVAQLNHDLVALGYLDATEVSAAWDEFTGATRLGVERLQDHLGVARDGGLELGEVAFLPSAARVTALQAMLGGPASGPVLSATSTRRTVTVALDPSLRSQVHTGDRVTVTLPSGRTTPGRVTSVGTVATTSDSNIAGDQGGSGNSSPTVPVHLRLTHPRAAGHLDQTLVVVSITDQTIRDVLAVQVTALMARAGGGYGVEVVDGGTHHLVAVEVGLFDDADGLVQVSGSGLEVGQRVVVPGDE